VDKWLDVQPKLCVEVFSETFKRFKYIWQAQTRMNWCFEVKEGCEYVNEVSVLDGKGVWICKPGGFFDRSGVLICSGVRFFDRLGSSCQASRMLSTGRPLCEHLQSLASKDQTDSGRNREQI